MESRSSRLSETPTPRANRFTPPGVLLLGLVFYIFVWRSAEVPKPNLVEGPGSENAERFSAARAHSTLVHLLGDQSPHPIGSEANRAVKRRVIETLEDAGAEVREQHALACVPNTAHCGFVENVIGTLAGDQTSTIVLMAHYDSTTNSPGAGDDGAGVATILEVLRLLVEEARAQGRSYRNTIQAVITDGEEEGLFGAEAFFGEHPDARNTEVLINVEGSGTAGPSNLLRSSPGSGSLVALYRETATRADGELDCH